MKKRILSIMLTLCMIMAFMPQTAFAGTFDFNFTISGNKVTINKYTGSDTVVEIPSKLGGDFPVTSIGDDAFKDCTSLTSVTIPNSVESIGYRAFQNCSSLASITIPNSVTSIGSRAFYACSGLTSITIPNSVRSIGNYSFEGCSNLTSIEIPNSVTSIGSNAFDPYNLNSIFLPDGLDVSSAKIPAATTQVRYSLDTEGKVTITGIKLGTGKTSVDIPSTISGNPVTAIGNFAFDSCYGLESVTFGENSQLKSIGNYAFLNCTSLTSINIPGSVTYIGMGAFRCGGLTSITVDPNNSNYSSADGVLFNKDKTELIHYPAGNTRTSYSIPSSVTSIGNKAFMSCKKLENVTFGVNSKLESIEEDAFYDCTSLKSIIIPNNVMVINERAFYGCTSLKSIFLSDKVSSIGIAAIPDTTSQVKYSLDTNKGEVTITEITLGTDKTSVDIPAEICGHSVVAVADGLLGEISSHTCAGGEATCQSKATCGICGNEYGEIDSTNHNLEKISAKDATVTETGNKEYWHCKDCGKYFSDENGKSEIIDLAAWKTGEGKLAKLPPEIINGKGMSIAAGETKELTFRSNADFSDFIRVELDGKTLDAKYYTAKEGSTIITLKADYVASLSAGNHTIGIVSTSGTATTEFTVNVQTASDNGSPKTGDNSNLLLWLALMILSASGTAGASVYSKKKRTNE